MRVIKFEVSFKSDGSVASPVAKQTEGGWALGTLSSSLRTLQQRGVCRAQLEARGGSH